MMGKMDMPKFLRFWFPVILYSGIIFYASSIPYLETPLPETQFDKILHVLEYIPFGLLLARGIRSIEIPVSRKAFWIWVILISFLYGASDEVHQSFVPGRYAGLADVISDTIGGMIGGYMYLLFKNKVKNR